MEVSTEELVTELQILDRLSRLVAARRLMVVGRLVDDWLDTVAEGDPDVSEAADG